MQENQIDPDDIIRLKNEYDVELVGDCLLIKGVYYVDEAGAVQEGTLVSKYNRTGPGRDHKVWLTGTPCDSQGRPLVKAMVHPFKVPQKMAGLSVTCMLSYKPDPIGTMLDDYYNKMTHYIRKITSYANVVGGAEASKGHSLRAGGEGDSPFIYPNHSIPENGLDEYESKIKIGKVAIVGAGGTGSYILDYLAKTPVGEIHVYDYDVIEAKNAFRWPGALSEEEAFSAANKAEMLCSKYSSIRKNVIAHPYEITDSNKSCLSSFDFVFCAIDHGPSRGIIANHLAGCGIPFIDVGIGVDKIDESTCLIARARVTLVPPGRNDIVKTLPISSDENDAVYDNIQVVELNSINAAMAIIKYKQHLGFYSDEEHSNQIRYNLSMGAILSG